MHYTFNTVHRSEQQSWGTLIISGKMTMSRPSSTSFPYFCLSFDIDDIQYHIGLMSFVFVIGPTERAVLASYTMVVPEHLHAQCTGTNSQLELVVPNWL